jgi:hypothetical protein
MTAIAVAAAEVGVWEQALGAGVEDIVTFARDCDQVRVVNVSGAAAIYFTVDGSAVTVGSKAAHWLPALANASKIVTVPTSGNTQLRVKSSGTPTYSAEGSS